MRIKRLETFSTRYIAFVRATLEDGSFGWGQLSTYNSDITADVFHRQAAPWVLGEEAWPIDPLIDRIEEKEHKFPGAYLKRAMAGLDTALWDLESKRQEKPVVTLLGGKPGRLRAYASSMRRDITPEAEAARFVELRDRFGFDAFKFRVAAEYGHDVDEWPGRTEAIVPAVRRALGPKAALLVDANSGFSPSRAIEVGKLLAAEGVEHFEEPCLYWELEQTKQVSEALDIAVTGGEQDCDLSIWRVICGQRIVDIAQPDVLYVGGIGRALKVAKLAEAAGLKVTPHAANLGPGHALHHASAGRSAQCREISRILHRGSGLLPLAIRRLPPGSLRDRGRPCHHLGGAGLGHRDRAGMARQSPVSGQRAELNRSRGLVEGKIF